MKLIVTLRHPCHRNFPSPFFWSMCVDPALSLSLPVRCVGVGVRESLKKSGVVSDSVCCTLFWGLSYSLLYVCTFLYGRVQYPDVSRYMLLRKLSENRGSFWGTRSVNYCTYSKTSCIFARLGRRQEASRIVTSPRRKLRLSAVAFFREEIFLVFLSN